MEIVCPNCSQPCVTDDELVVGQHVLCPFCNVKFTYGDSASTAESRSAGKLMDVKCPGCGTEYEVDASDAGQDVECEVCGRKFVIGAQEKNVREESPPIAMPKASSFRNKPKSNVDRQRGSSRLFVRAA